MFLVEIDHRWAETNQRWTVRVTVVCVVWLLLLLCSLILVLTLGGVRLDLPPKSVHGTHDIPTLFSPVELTPVPGHIQIIDVVGGKGFKPPCFQTPLVQPPLGRSALVS